MTDNSRPTILIVEDDSEIRTLLALVFQIENFTVLQAVDGEEALRLFREHQEKLVLMITDLGLPKLGGVELIREVRSLKPSVKIIGSSGYGRANIREEVLQAGGDEFLPKPYITTDLIQTVKQLLSAGQSDTKELGT